jgi:hypothetical protein
MWDAFKSGAKEDFGGAPLGFDPTGEAEKFMQQHGVFRDPSQARWGDSLRHDYEATLRPAAAIADAFARLPGALVGGIADAVEEYNKNPDGSLSGSNEGGAIRSAAEFALSGAPGMDLFSAPTRLPSGHIIDQKIGGLATQADFENAATHIAKIAEPAEEAGAVRAPVEPDVIHGKMLGLFHEYGIHPNEVLAHATQDPALAKDLASDNPMLPNRYTGIDPAAMHADAIQENADAGKSTKKIGGISDELNDALQPRTSWPQTPTAVSPPTVSSRFGDLVGSLVDRFGLGNIVNDLQRQVTPMAMRDSSVAARSSARDLANTNRVARWDFQRLHGLLTDEFSPAEREQMWTAADKDSVAMQKGEAPTELAKLDPRLRNTVQALQQRSSEMWEEAQRSGVVQADAKALPGYVPREVLFEYGKTDPGRLGPALDRIGSNTRTASSNLMRREHLTTEETEAAAREVHESAKVVRDIRTLPLATMRLQQAIAGRKLLNSIREVGDLTTPEGEASTVYEGAVPAGQESKFFTIPQHPAFWSWRPKFKDGQIVKGEDGKLVFEKTPLMVRQDFEGPLRAVMGQQEGAVYRGMMTAKSKATSLIMYSPLLHNAVIAGRVLPAMGGNPVATARLYFRGNVVRNTPEMMREAIQNGMAPIGRGGAASEWAQTLQDPQMKPGRSITAQVLSAIPNLFDERAGTAVKQAIDKAGDFWHNTLLWNRVADMQAGIYDHYMKDAMAHGIDRTTASRTAAQLSNRYAGTMPAEALSDMARKTANVMLFSRSFTLGTIGSLKDMFTGLPRDVLAQVERDQGVQAMLNVRSYAQRKALGIVAADMALLYAGGSLTQSAINVMRGDDTIGEEGQGYIDRLEATMKRLAANPFEALDPFAVPDGVSSTSENEPGKEQRILVGYDSHGTALYVKNPTGKTAEDMTGWMTHPAQTVFNKLSTLVRPGIEIAANQDFRGKPIYDPYAKTPEDYLRNMGKIVFHYMAAQAPDQTLDAIKDLMTGTPTDDEKDIDVAKIVGPLLGLVFSPGAPGGPAAGEYFRANEMQKYAQDQVMPQARKDIKEGRIGEAKEHMTAAGIPPRLQQFYVETTLNPKARFVKSKFKQFLNSLPEAQRARVDKQIERSDPSE